MTQHNHAPIPAGTSAGWTLDVGSAPVPSPAAVSGAEPAPSDWQQYVAAVVRHRWIVLAVTVLGTTAGVVATRFLDPYYTAKAILWIEPGNDRGGRGAGEVITSDELMEAPGWVELVTANAVLDSVVLGLRLYLQPTSPLDATALSTFQIDQPAAVHPGRYRLTVDRGGLQYDLTLADGPLVERGRVGDPIGSNLGFRWTPPPGALTPGRTVQFAITAPYDAGQQLAKGLKAHLDPGGTFLRLQLKGTNPALATATLNAIVNRVVAVAADLKREKFEELVKILGGQYEHAQQTLHAAEVALKDFRVRTTGIMPLGPDGGQEPAVASSVGLRVTLEQQRRDRRAIERLLAQAGAAGGAIAVDALAEIPAVQHSSDLALALQEYGQKQSQRRAARYKYTEESAPVQQLQREIDVLERQVIPNLARRLAADLAARDTGLAARTDSAFRDLRRIPPLALEEGRLTREVASAEELFTGIRQRYEATRLALISSLPDVRILDAAVEPRRPASSYAPLLILLSFVTSFGGVVMGVTLLDRVDPKVRYPEQVTAQMRLTILGAVPHVSGRLGDSESNPAIEAMRGLRLRVLHAYGTDGPLLLTVTSPGIGEGKSFVSVNLALSFADAGYQTLLIDGDVRRGAQHWVLETPRKPGLTDVLAGKAPLEAALRETSYPGLSFLSAGTRMHRAPELLLSQKMRDLMGRLRAGYGIIIVDSAPLAAGVDPLVLATLTGNLMLVLRAGTTDLKLAASKLHVMDALPVRTIGAVLNDVRPGGAYRYYTYDLAGYEEVDEERSGRPGILGGRE